MDERTTDVPSLQYKILYQHVTLSSEFSIQGVAGSHSQSIYELTVPTQPMTWVMWCDVWRLATPQGLCSLHFSNSGVGSFHKNQICKCKCCETGPMVFRLYPRGLESLTACRCRYKGSTFFSVVLRLWVLVQPGFEPTTSRSAVWRSPNWANQAAVSSPIFSFTDLEAFLRLIYPRA